MNIPALDEVLQIFRKKTAEAFKVSLLTGAVAGGADDVSLRLLEEFSYLIGTAYQLKDDLEDITEAGDGHVLRNPSALISALAEKAEESEIINIRRSVEHNDINAIRELLNKYRIADLAEKLIGEYLVRIESSLSGLKNLTLKLALHEIVGKTFSKYL
jgi:geranylgeranyl pyrophosphate synthase